MMKLAQTAFLFAALATLSQADTIFSNIPSALDPNYPSQGYQATSTAELGNKVTFGGTARKLSSATLTMSAWAKQSDWLGVGDATGYDHTFTLNLYGEGSGQAVGSPLGSKTITTHVPWRPEDALNAPDPINDPHVWEAPDGNFYHGMAFNIAFDLTSLNLTAPDTIIFGLAFNTYTHGYTPLGVDGPYSSLNYALTENVPTVGIDNDPNDAYLNSTWAGAYGDLGAGGTGTFRQDPTSWLGYAPMAQFEAVPEPATMAALAIGLVGIARRRRKA